MSPNPRPSSRHTSSATSSHPNPHVPSPPPPHPPSIHATSFRPFFTLLSTPTAQHHPKVHYIFADDPPLAPIPPVLNDSVKPLTPQQQPPQQQPKAPTLAANERALILDLDPTGTRVINASSLSSEFAITNVVLEEAPQWTDDPYGDGMAWMVRVEGVEAGELGAVSGGDGGGGTMMVAEGSGSGSGDRRSGGLEVGMQPGFAGSKVVRDVERLVERYQEQMKILNNVINLPDQLRADSGGPIDEEQPRPDGVASGNESGIGGSGMQIRGGIGMEGHG
ncbi:hypothetical protein EX30DRAFT_338591 [Ascodesmis nigricans]|uniref:Uncharacterized protein n=1 Tax=Ascodesmis nigricans TaxID=341454 RepID=A0A4S2N4B9_9PEZI|nr:hypothetical protein EX30DRAFT_338591 [Ascodesmis nigricans]